MGPSRLFCAEREKATDTASGMLVLITNSSCLVEGAISMDTCYSMPASVSWKVNLFTTKQREIYLEKGHNRMAIDFAT